MLDAANGEEALSVARECRANEIDLLLTDVVMPQMGGKELAELLRPLIPRLKVMFISGFPDEMVVPSHGWNSGTSFVPKPFTPAELTMRVREALDTPRPGT